MKAIVLGAGRGVQLPGGEAVPKFLLEGLAGWRVLDWLVAALREGAGVDDVVLVAGDAAPAARTACPGLRVVENPRWAQQHVVGSLFSAESELVGPVFVSYADIVYRPVVVAALRAAPGEFALAVDTSWRERTHGRPAAVLRNAEKVVVRDGRVVRIGKDIALDDDIHGEFIGLARLGERGAATLRSAYRLLQPLYRDRSYRGARNLDAACLSDLLQELIEQGAQVDAVPIAGDWAEVDVPADLARFVFGTKAETLERLRPMLQEARISEGVVVRVGQWQADPGAVAQSLAQRFGATPLAVRSSALREDSAAGSLAGRYQSVLGVEAGDVDAIHRAVETVVRSLGRDGGGAADQILVQPCLTDVAMSGVLMTRDVASGADYTVVNYDECSRRTDTVTSGGPAPTRTVLIYRGGTRLPSDPRLRALLRTARELEAITGSDALDVEFAFGANETLHVLQVRPIAATGGWAPVDRAAHRAELDAVRALLDRRMRPLPGLAGGSTVFGQMPDWNPAEMIGSFPHPLARSLYEHLITDVAWRTARASIGYRDPFGWRLMATLADRPYVDVRCSANNLSPAELPDAVAGRVIDAGLALLRARPELHDKIEFEVFPTCLDLGFGAAALRLCEHGLPPADVAVLQDALRVLTRRIVRGGVRAARAQLLRTESLAPFAAALGPGAGADPADHPARLAALAEATIRDGTVPFAVLARYAFVATALLRSLRDAGVVDPQELDAFLGGIRTVGGELADDLTELASGRTTRGAFLGRYGHLRRAPTICRPNATIRRSRPTSCPTALAPAGRRSAPRGLRRRAPGLAASTRARVDVALASAGLEFGADELLAFARASIAGRERAKLAFTRNVSAMLELIAEWGTALRFTREDLVLLELPDVLTWAQRGMPPHAVDQLARRVAAARLRREVTAHVLLPPLITCADDLEVVALPASRPNFVSKLRVTAKARALTGGPADLQADLKGHLVVLPGADPGYDWIFGRQIAGLVTCYGGANSHMTIRCAEFGLPAAIGCGKRCTRAWPARPSCSWTARQRWSVPSEYPYQSRAQLARRKPYSFASPGGPGFLAARRHARHALLDAPLSDLRREEHEHPSAVLLEALANQPFPVLLEELHARELAARAGGELASLGSEAMAAVQSYWNTALGARGECPRGAAAARAVAALPGTRASVERRGGRAGLGHGRGGPSVAAVRRARAHLRALRREVAPRFRGCGPRPRVRVVGAGHGLARGVGVATATRGGAAGAQRAARHPRSHRGADPGGGLETAPLGLPRAAGLRGARVGDGRFAGGGRRRPPAAGADAERGARRAGVARAARAGVPAGDGARAPCAGPRGLVGARSGRCHRRRMGLRVRVGIRRRRIAAHDHCAGPHAGDRDRRLRCQRSRRRRHRTRPVPRPGHFHRRRHPGGGGSAGRAPVVARPSRPASGPPREHMHLLFAAAGRARGRHGVLHAACARRGTDRGAAQFWAAPAAAGGGPGPRLRCVDPRDGPGRRAAGSEARRGGLALTPIGGSGLRVHDHPSRAQAPGRPRAGARSCAGGPPGGTNVSITVCVSEPWDYHNWEPVLRHLQGAQVYVLPFWARIQLGQGEQAQARTIEWLRQRGVQAQTGPFVLEPHVLATLPILPRMVDVRYSRQVRMLYAVISKAYTYSAKNLEYDCVLVASAFGRDLLARHGVRAEVVGYPKLDDAFNGRIDRRTARERLGLPSDRPVVAYLPTFGEGCSAERFREAIGELPAEVEVVLQLHPVSYIGELHRFAGYPPRVRWIGEQDATIATLIAADVVVTDYSGAAFEACALDRPVVLLDDPALPQTEDVERQYRDFAPRVCEPAGLRAAVEQALAHGEQFAERRAHYRERFFEHHGQGGRRAAEALRGLSEESRRERERDVDALYNRLRALEAHLHLAR